MRPVLTFLSCVFVGLLTMQSASAQSDVDHQRIARETLERHIQPSYKQLASAFADLRSEAQEFCTAADDNRLGALRQTFANAVKAWGRIAHIHFGPVRENNRYERIWFWPDRKGIAKRQVANAIRNEPEGYDDAATLGEKSIAVQGMGALEQVLYGPEIEALTKERDGSGFPCRYMQAIAGNLANLASAVEAQWGAENYGRIWLQAGPENPSYLQQQETTFALANTFLTAAERIRDVELARPLGVSQNRRVLPGPLADSKLSMVFIAARIEGLRALFAESGFADELLRAAQGGKSPTAEDDIRQVLFELQLAQNRASELAKIPNLLGNAAERGKAVALGFPLRSIRQMSARALGELTDLPVGFNASDGD